jgi:glucosamine 6-phosphate synthetase-like amidotransferase/phosphosugar isomerase protein
VLYEDVQRALEENLDLLDPEKDKSAHTSYPLALEGALKLKEIPIFMPKAMRRGS